MGEYKLKSNIDKYSKILIDIITPPACGRKVFEDEYLLLNIFSYFKSGWGIRNATNRHYCQYYDIFGQLVIVNQVTDTITNPYHDKRVHEKEKKNSYYVGPVIEWYKSFNCERLTSKSAIFE